MRSALDPFPPPAPPLMRSALDPRGSWDGQDSGRWTSALRATASGFGRLRADSCARLRRGGHQPSVSPPDVRLRRAPGAL
eukprot:12586660-Alexandrium_andersonii.AAC.1